MNLPSLALLGLLAIPTGIGVVVLEQRKPQQKAAQPGTPAPTAQTPGFRVAGIQVNSPVHTGADPASDDTFGVQLAFFGTFARTNVAIECTRAAGGIIGIEDERCRLARFADDRGTNLVKEDAFPGPFEATRVSDDGRHFVFTVPSDALPDSAAARLTLAGTLALRVATAQETFTAEDADLDEGASIELGGFELEVRGNGPSEWGEGYTLTVASKRDLGTIVSWTLVTDDGTELTLMPTMSMSGMGHWEQSLQLDREIEQADFRITCWKDLQVVELPFELSSGLGLR